MNLVVELVAIVMVEIALAPKRFILVSVVLN